MEALVDDNLLQSLTALVNDLDDIDDEHDNRNDVDPLDYMIGMMHADGDDINAKVKKAMHRPQGRHAQTMDNDPDQYAWLRVPTKHSFLRKLLRTKLIELFTERGMSSKFENLVTNFKKRVKNSDPVETTTANHKVAEDFFGLKLSGEDTTEGPEGLTFNQKVKRFDLNRNLLEEAIIVGRT